MKEKVETGKASPPYFVVDHLYRGPLPDGDIMDELKQLDVVRLVTLCDESYAADSIRKECERRGLQNIHIPLSPFVRPGAEEIAYFLTLLSERDATPTYVHCIHGRDRTGTMLGIFRISQGWSISEAMAEMQEYGFFMGFRELLDALRGYGESSPFKTENDDVSQPSSDGVPEKPQPLRQRFQRLLRPRHPQ